MFAKSMIQAWLLATCCMALAAAQFQSVAMTEGSLQGTLESKVTTADPAANGQDTITLKYTVPGTSWVAVGVNPTGGGMVNSEVVIGKPEDDTVLKYAISARGVSAVVEQPNQTLINTSLVQANGNTVLTFTKLLEETGEYSINPGAVNTFVAAFGFSNSFSFHEGFGVQQINVPAATPVAPDTPSPTSAPVVAPTDAPAVPTMAPAPTEAPTVGDSASPSMVTGSVLFTVVVVSSSLALFW
ncbi:unnamed protein product [Cylindrotheca closterium]|uniref:DOMON domain-containing protein n=1 Tax=Cylindrotheca closterium TaxID=2856 RepID=A0AAD2JLQ8_9STRA|nr:unnamed protein product [Cylindrotheca closterium]